MLASHLKNNVAKFLTEPFVANLAARGFSFWRGEPMRGIQITSKQSKVQQDIVIDEVMRFLNEQSATDGDDYNLIHIEFIKVPYLVVDIDYTYC
jgi:hypothetical protein